MVPCLFGYLPGSLHGHVHSGQVNSWLRRTQRTRVPHANCKFFPQFSKKKKKNTTETDCSTSISTPSYTHPHPSFSTPPTVAAPAVCSLAWVVSLVSSHLLQVSIFGFHFFVHETNGITGQHYLAASSSGILWLGAGGIWLSAFVMVFLPVEMRNRQMF